MFERLKRRLQRFGSPAEASPARTPAAAAEGPAAPDPPVAPPPAPQTGPSPLVSRLLVAASAAAQEPRQEPDRAGGPAGRRAADQAIASIDGRRYALNDLPEDLQQLLRDIQAADVQIRLRQDRLFVLAQGQLDLRERLRRGLTAIEPMAPPPPGAGPQPSTRQT